MEKPKATPLFPRLEWRYETETKDYTLFTRAWWRSNPYMKKSWGILGTTMSLLVVMSYVQVWIEKKDANLKQQAFIDDDNAYVERVRRQYVQQQIFEVMHEKLEEKRRAEAFATAQATKADAAPGEAVQGAAQSQSSSWWPW